MAEGTPIEANKYWEVLSPDQLQSYDAALGIIAVLIEDTRKLADYQATPGGPLTPILVKAAGSRQVQIRSLAEVLMPPREAFYKPPGIPPEDDWKD